MSYIYYILCTYTLIYKTCRILRPRLKKDLKAYIVAKEGPELPPEILWPMADTKRHELLSKLIFFVDAVSLFVCLNQTEFYLQYNLNYKITYSYCIPASLPP